MPINEQPYTKEDIDVLLSLDDEWLRIGSRLSVIAYDLIDRDDYSAFLDIHVGFKVCSEEDDKYTIGAQVERHASMLFAMAMEAWMKGLLLEQFSIPTWKSTEADYQERIQHAREFGTDPEQQALYKEFWNEVFERQRKLFDKHKKHNLLYLADDCGVAAYLSSDDKEFLNRLSSAIERGRYPAAFHPKKMVAPDSELSNTVKWSRLQQAVFKRYSDLYPEGM